MPNEEEAGELEQYRAPAPEGVQHAEFFQAMINTPRRFMYIPLFLYFVILLLGWSTDDKIQKSVSEIWIPTRGELNRNREYVERFGADTSTVSSGAMMARSRDGKNMLTATRLEEIRSRMEAIESITVEYNGITFTYADLCSSNNLGKGTIYRAPCFRLSPMDLFKEARWFFEEDHRATWYDVVVQNGLASPLIPRFGVMTTQCVSPQSSVCDITVGSRLNPDVAESLGLDRSYANPLALFADVSSLQQSDPCRICYEEGFVKTIDDLLAAVRGSFGVLALELQRFQATLTPESREWPVVVQNLEWAANLSESVTREQVEDFYYYFVVRGLYISLGAQGYVNNYKAFQPLLAQCEPPLVCPPVNTTLPEAQAALANHADNVFSSVNLAGIPYPWWSEGDGTGALFAGTQPVSGSGVDMSGSLLSIVAYLDVQRFDTEAWSPLYVNDTNGFANPTDAEWERFVAHNPIFNWFVADLIEEDNFCNNGNLTGTNTDIPELDGQTAFVMASVSPRWCTPHRIPNYENRGTPPYTRQWFARMWYDYLIDSGGFLGITQGVDDPYSWTLGTGCGYSLRGSRDAYTNKSESDILFGASRELYYIDEGNAGGAIDRNLIIGGATPVVGDYSFENPLQEVTVFQSLYLLLVPELIVERVRNCNRPGGPVEITEEDAEEILEEFKMLFEEVWAEGWDDENAGEVQFTCLVDDVAVPGTTNRILTDITLDNGRLTAISILSIAVFSVLFLFDPDPVESRVILALIGVVLVVLSYFSSVGLALLLGIKIDITIAWTLPFIILGLGVDDMYIVLEALNSEDGYGDHNFLNAMTEVVAPVTMTSTVNACMFLVLNVSDIPAVFLTARVAVICVIFLYLVITVCFPAFCYLDMKRQRRGQWDVFFCKRTENRAGRSATSRDFRAVWLFNRFYEPLVLGRPSVRMVVHAVVWLSAVALLAIGSYGINQRKIGLGLEDFVPDYEQSSVWAVERSRSLASFPVSMTWGDIDYTDPEAQMQMLSQYERVVDTFYFAEADTRFVWIARFLIWSSRICTNNVSGRRSTPGRCGKDVMFEDGSYCTGGWTENIFGLRERNFPERGAACEPFQGGICRPGTQMHFRDLEDLELDPSEAEDMSFCPIIEGWSGEKWQHCLRQFRNITNFGGGGFIFADEDEQGSETECAGEYNRDENIMWPIPLTRSPTMYAYRLFEHEDTVEMIRQAAEHCESEELYCFMTGVPFSFWNQYLDIFEVMLRLFTYALIVAFIIAFCFLYAELNRGVEHTRSKIIIGSLIGALLIVVTMILSFFTVFGLSVLSGTNLTGFSKMSYILSIGFATEYSVHIVARWLKTDLLHRTSLDRVRETMSFLTLPTFMSFVSSTLGVMCLAFTDFEFNKIFFFRPLIITMLVTYFYGCWWLPCALTLLDFDAVKLGKPNGRPQFFATQSQLGNESGDKEGPLPMEVVTTNGDGFNDISTNIHSKSDFDASLPISSMVRSEANEYENYDIQEVDNECPTNHVNESLTAAQELVAKIRTNAGVTPPLPRVHVGPRPVHNPTVVLQEAPPNVAPRDSVVPPIPMTIQVTSSPPETSTQSSTNHLETLKTTQEEKVLPKHFGNSNDRSSSMEHGGGMPVLKNGGGDMTSGSESGEEVVAGAPETPEPREGVLTFTERTLLGMSVETVMAAVSTRHTVIAPIGRLGIMIGSGSDGPVVEAIGHDSPLKSSVKVGDRIIALNSRSTREASGSQLMAMLVEAGMKERKLTVERVDDAGDNAEETILFGT